MTKWKSSIIVSLSDIYLYPIFFPESFEQSHKKKESIELEIEKQIQEEDRMGTQKVSYNSVLSLNFQTASSKGGTLSLI